MNFIIKILSLYLPFKEKKYVKKTKESKKIFKKLLKLVSTVRVLHSPLTTPTPTLLLEWE